MNFLDLFAGIGGFRFGMERAGHKCVGYCEIDKYARLSYNAIHNTEGEIDYKDITEVTNEEFRKLRGKVDVICGGFPCQAFSIAGVGDSINFAYINSKLRRGRVGKQVANTLLTSPEQAVILPDLQIRKLTPRECWRLQGFPDWAFDKAQEVNSNSQLYKQAGNSVTVNVIEEIAKRLK